MKSSQRLAAIMFTDIVGYTALMSRDQDAALKLLSKNRMMHKSIIEKFSGEWLKEMGDGTLASFNTTSEAVRCAGAIQNQAQRDGISLRIGIHVGEVVFEGKDVFGDGVNIASRIEALTPPGGIWVSEAVHKNVLNKRGIETMFIQETQLKNVKDSVRIYEVKVETNEASPTPARSAEPARINQRKVLLAVVIFAMLVLGYGYNHYTKSIRNSDEQIIEKSIAVLPFSNESSNQENLYFCNGIMEGILDHLAKISELTVISRSSVERFRHDRPAMKKMAGALNVQYLVEGSVQRIGDQVIIFAQLIYADSDRHLWSQRYDRSLNDVFAVQTEVTEAIAEQLQATISPDVKRRIEVVPTTEIEAYDLYSRGRNYQYAYDFGLDVMDLQNAESLYREALELDSTFALAYVGMGLVNLSRTGFLGQRSINESQYVDSIRQFALKALRFDNELAEAYYLRGYYYSSTGDFDKAITDQTKAVFLNPNMAEAYLALGKLNRNDPHNAIINIKKAMSLEKDGLLTPSLLSALGNIYLDIGAFQRAEQYFRESVRLRPDYFYGYDRLWALSCAQGKFKEALEISGTLCKLDKEQCLYSAEMSHFYLENFDSAWRYHDENDEFRRKRGREVGPTLNGIYIQWKLGNDEEASRLLEEFVVFMRGRQGRNVQYELAIAYASIGDVKKAMMYLKQHRFWKAGSLSHVTHNPVFEILRDNEEFKELIKKLNEEKAKIREEIFALEAAGKL